MTIAAPVLDIRRRTALAAGTLLLLPFHPTVATAQEAPPARALDVPYVPTPMDAVRKMLEMARVTQRDLLYDLGCGDGRIVVTAAKERGARGVGVDLDPNRIDDANRNAKEAGVTEQVKFVVGDLFETDVAPATVVTLYLLPAINLRLKPQLWRQLKVGTRVVSHSFDMGTDWPPEDTQRVGTATLYRWTVGRAQKRRATATA